MGFTLIETFVAITILMIIVIGPMSLLSTALKDARSIGDELTASYLAQEGVELMIANRDVGGSLLNPGTVTISDCQLRFDENIKGYSCDLPSSFPLSIFTRTVVSEEKVAGQQYKITSTVSRPTARDVVSSSIIFKH